jgi:hypothetical protein
MSEYKKSHLDEWMKLIKKSIVPPLCVEIFLINYRSYFLNCVAYWEDDDPIAVLRIWDLREMTVDDIDTLKQKMNSVQDRKEYGKPIKIHKKLDWANLRVSKDYITYVIEWHDRLWPVAEIGFKSGIKSN